MQRKATYRKHFHADPADKAKCPMCMSRGHKRLAVDLYDNMNHLLHDPLRGRHMQYAGCVASIPKDGTVMVCGPIPKVLPLLLEAFSILWGNEKTLDLQVDTFHDPHFNAYRARIVLDCAQLVS